MALLEQTSSHSATKWLSHSLPIQSSRKQAEEMLQDKARQEILRNRGGLEKFRVDLGGVDVLRTGRRQAVIAVYQKAIWQK